MRTFMQSINYKEMNQVILDAAKAFRILCVGELANLEKMIIKYLRKESYWCANLIGAYETKEMDKFLSSLRVYDEDPTIYPLDGTYDRYRISFGETYSIVISIRDYYKVGHGGIRRDPYHGTTHYITCEVVE